MTYCDLGCRRPADILHGRQKLCARCFKAVDTRWARGERG